MRGREAAAVLDEQTSLDDQRSLNDQASLDEQTSRGKYPTGLSAFLTAFRGYCRPVIVLTLNAFSTDILGAFAEDINMVLRDWWSICMRGAAKHVRRICDHCWPPLEQSQDRDYRTAASQHGRATSGGY